MFAFFENISKPDSDKTIKELNKLTNPYIKYEWNYTKKDDYTKKNGFYLSFPQNSFQGDILIKYIEKSFEEQDLTIHVIGNGFNAVNGKRLLIESDTISLEQMEKAHHQ